MEEFRYEDGRTLGVIHDECSCLGSCDCHIEQTPLLSIRVFITLAKNEIENRIIIHQ